MDKCQPCREWLKKIEERVCAHAALAQQHHRVEALRIVKEKHISKRVFQLMRETEDALQNMDMELTNPAETTIDLSEEIDQKEAEADLDPVGMVTTALAAAQAEAEAEVANMETEKLEPPPQDMLTATGAAEQHTQDKNIEVDLTEENRENEEAAAVGGTPPSVLHPSKLFTGRSQIQMAIDDFVASEDESPPNETAMSTEDEQALLSAQPSSLGRMTPPEVQNSPVQPEAGSDTEDEVVDSESETEEAKSYQRSRQCTLKPPASGVLTRRRTAELKKTGEDDLVDDDGEDEGQNTP